MSERKGLKKSIYNKHSRYRLSKGVLCLVVLVVFITTYMLILPAITMETDNASLEAFEPELASYNSVALEAVGRVINDTSSGVKYVLEANADGLYTMTVNATSDGDVVLSDHLMDSEELSVYKNSIKKIVFNISADTLVIGNGAFSGCASLYETDFSGCGINHIEINAYAFSDCISLNIIDIPSGLRVLGEYAFSGCTSLSNISFGRTEYDENSLLELPSYIFKNCKSLKEIDLIPLQNLDVIYGEVFLGCTELTTIKVPGNVSTLNERSFGTNSNATVDKLTSLSSLIFEDNYKLTYWPFNVIRNSGLKELDLRPFKAMTDIGGGFTFPATSLTTIWFPKSLVTMGTSVFRNISNIKNVYFEEDSQLTVINTYVFLNTSGLTEMDLSVCTKLKSISNMAFSGSSIKEITIPESVTFLGQAFAVANEGSPKVCAYLKDIYFNARALNNCDTLAFGSVTDATFTIGNTVDAIPVNFVTSLNGHASKLVFEGENEFTVAGEGTSTGLDAPLDILGGDYYVSAEGDLYKVDKVNSTATLIYKESAEGDAFVIPEKVGLEDSYTVTGIGPYAFRTSGVKFIDFEDISVIESVDSNAFIQSEQLASISGYSSVIDVINYFSDHDIELTEEGFYSTALAGAGVVRGEWQVFDASVSTTGIFEMLPIQSESTSESKYEFKVTSSNKDFLTGQEETITVYASGSEGSQNVLRLYFESEEECTRLKEVQEIAGCPVKYVENVDGTHVSYYEIGPWTDTGSTGILQFTFCYPNMISDDNNHLKMWAVAGSKADFDTMGENLILPWNGENEPDILAIYPDLEIGRDYFDITWDTLAYSHPVIKDISGTPTVLYSSDKLPVVSGLKYNVNLQDNTDTDDGRIESDTNAGKLNASNSYGSDFVAAAEFEDILELPEGFTWREGLLDAVKNGNYTCSLNSSLGNVYISINEIEHLVCTINRTETKNVYYDISAIDIEVNENNQLVVKWTCTNTKEDVEIQSCSVDLAYGNEVIVYDEEAYKSANPDAEIIAPVLKNIVSSTEKYSYAEDKTTVYETSDSFVISGKGSLEITKVTVNAEDKYNGRYFRFGEDVTYKVTVSNPTPYVYDDLSYASDNLKNYIYIKPENIVKMFNEADLNEDCNLVINISSASFEKSFDEIRAMTDLSNGVSIDSVISVDGKTEENIYSTQYIGNVADYSEKYAENTSYISDNESLTTDIQTKKAGVSIKKNEENLDLTITYNNTPVTFSIPCNIEALVNAWNNLGYVVTSDTVYGYQYNYLNTLEGGEVEEHYIYASFKDSLMKTGKDVVQNYSYPNTLDSEYGNGSPLVAYNNSKVNILSSTFPYEYIKADLVIEKTPELERVEDETVIDYKVNLKHYGKGSYDVLPVVDSLTGIQAVLASVSDNHNSDWAKSGLFHTYNEEYYILMPPEGEDTYTFNGVMVGNYYADSVTVNVTRDANGYVSNIQTIIKWYMLNTAENDFSVEFRYKALVDLGRLGYNKNNVKFSVSNTAYAGDRQAHRIYEVCEADGSSIKINKHIVTEESSGGYEYDVLAKKSNISQGARTVTYRLEINNPNDDTAVTVKGSSFHDQLPLQTLEADGYGFEWSQGENVFIRYEITEGVSVSYGGTEITEADDTHWYLTDVDPKVASVISEKQKFICWRDDFAIKIDEGCTFYIYVTLNFPGEDDEWSEYVAANDSPILYNTFYCGGGSETVTHDLVDSGKAFLQKGVYELGYYPKSTASATYGFAAYYALENRTTYRNTTYIPTYDKGTEGVPTGKGSIAYYVVLANTGNTKLYLSTIYDQLPEGFEFYSLRNNTVLTNGSDTYGYTGTGVGTYAHLRQDFIKEGSKNFAHPLAVVGTDIDWSKANLNGYRDGESITVTLTGSEIVDGHQQLAFDLSGGILDTQTDDIGSYLEPGQWITFGYECLIGYDYETEDVAENTLAMKYMDPNGTGAIVDNSSPVEVSKRVNKSASNDGTRELWSNSEADNYGFSSDSEDASWWLASQVSVYRGTESIPGITKTVKDNNTQNQVEHSNVNLLDIAEWSIKVHNDGDTLISDYVIEDTIEAPHHFVGTVSLSSYTNDRMGENYVSTNKIGLAGVNTKPDELFTISERDYANEEYLAVSVMDGYYKYKIPIDGTETKILTKYGYGSRASNHYLYVSFTKDEVNGTETLRIRFENNIFGIAPNGYNLLKYQTQNITQVYNSVPAVYNTATLIPNDSDDTYNYNSVKGSVVTNADGDMIGVQDSASISTDVSFPTTSSKSIQMNVGEDVYTSAVGDEAVNAIVTKDVTKEFTYTLTVNNAKSRAMNKLVVIDNLPQYGDTNTLSDKVTRDSGFRVNLSNTPDFKVIMTTYTYDENGEVADSSTRDMDADEYTIEYSTIKNGSFSDADWQGLADDTSQWTKWDEANVPAWDIIKSIRSIRWVFDDGTAVEGDRVIGAGDSSKSIPAGATINLSFNAVIDEEATGEDIALEGETAWNTFGYEYLIIDDNGIPNFLFATPQKVGISVPIVPTLSKALINRTGSVLNAAKDEWFQFIIYNGPTLSFTDYTVDSIGKALSENGRRFTYVEVSVPAGKSASEEIDLASLVEYEYSPESGFNKTDRMWGWEFTYDESGLVVPGEFNIVELDSNSSFAYTNAGGGARSQNDAISYDPFNNLQIRYVNMRKDYEILLLKTDGGTEYLANAVFALYSPNAKDLLSDEEQASMATAYALDTAEAIINENEVSYYLCDIAVSGSDGRVNWKNLCEDKYIVKELKPPDGYEIKVGEEQRQALYPYDASQKIVYMTVVNKPGVVLPSTGGQGTYEYRIIGMLLIISSFGLLAIKRKRLYYNDS